MTYFVEWDVKPQLNQSISVVVLQGCEPITGFFAGDLHAVDYIWFSSVSLDVLGVLKVVDPPPNEGGLPTATFPSDHMSIKASFAFK